MPVNRNVNDTKQRLKPTPVGEDRRKHQHRLTLQQLGAHLHTFLEMRHERSHVNAREKMLCDLILHQQFFLHLLQQQNELKQQQHQAPNSVDGCQHDREQQHMPYRYSFQHTCAFCTHVWSQQQQQQQEQQAEPQQQLPDSYVACLLRSATPADLQRILDMAPQDWLQHFAALFPQLAVLIESVERYDFMAANQVHTTVSSLAASAPLSAADGGAGGLGADSMHSLVSTICSISPGDGDNSNSNNGSGSFSSNESSHSATTTTNIMNATTTTSTTTSSSSLLGLMFPAQAYRPGLCPVLDMQALLARQGETCKMLMLACGLNHIPLFTAGATCYSPGPEVTDKPLHWQRVVDKLQLSEEQELQLSICVEEYKRVSQMLEAEGVRLVVQEAVPNLQLTAAAAAATQKQPPPQQQQQQQRFSGGQQSGSTLTFFSSQAQANAVGLEPQNSSVEPMLLEQQQQQPQPDGRPPLALCCDDDDNNDTRSQDYLDQQLQLLMLRRQAHLFSTSACIVNTLCAYQQSVMIVASFPFIPSLMSVAEIAAARLRERRQQQLAKVEEQVVAEGMQGYYIPAAELVARVAATAAATAAGGGASSGGQAGGDGCTDSQSVVRAVLGQYQQRRGEQLEAHKQLCWAEMDRIYQQEQAQMLQLLQQMQQ